MTYNPAGGKTYTLGASISSTATTITLSSFALPVSGTLITMTVLNTDIAYGTIGPKTSSAEFISFTGVTQNADGTATLTGVTRGLNKVSPFTANASYRLPHSGQTLFILSDAPQVFSEYAALRSANIFGPVQEFTLLPTSSGGNAINGNELVTYAQALAMASGTTNINRVVVAGNGGEAITAGQLLYLLVSDGEWYKCDADTAATVDNIILGIAQGAGSDGVAITSGVLLFGLDSNQAGLTNNTAYYASNTAGAISSTVGTVEVSVGISRSTTSLLFYPRYNQQLTEDQQDALVGTSGTPSATNKYVTNDDTSGTGAVVRSSLLTGGVSYPLGEAFTGATSPQPAVLLDDLQQSISDTNTAFGAAGSPMVAIKVIPRTTVTIASVISEMVRGTDPGTNMTVEIQTDTAGVPSGTPITNGTSGTVATSTLNTWYKTTTFTFASPPTLTAGTTYHFVYKTSATNANQITMLGLTNAKKYASFVGSSNNGASWSTNAIVPVLKVTTGGGSSYSLWQSDGDGNLLVSGFNGFVTSTGSAGATGTFVKTGNLAGFTGLTTGADYYVQNAIGTIGTTKQGCFVGRATSATQIDITLQKLSTAISIIAATTLLNNGSGSMVSPTHTAPADGFFMGQLNATYMNAQQYLQVLVNGNLAGGAYSDSSANGGGGYSIPCKKGDSISYIQGVSGAGTSPSIGVVTFQTLS